MSDASPLPLFEMAGAGLRFGAVRALSSMDLTVDAGEQVAVIGPSGAGKSSLIQLLNGTLSPTEGHVRALGVDLATASGPTLRGVQRRFGTIHQQFDLVEQLRVVHNVNAGRLGSWPFRRAVLSLVAPREVDRARQALQRVGIGEKLYTRTGDLSGGEKQRVAIARVLVQQPAAVLADEPLASLDPTRGREIMDILHGVSSESGTSLLASLHDVDVALEYFPRIVGLRAGQVAFDAPPHRIPRAAVDDLYAIEREAGSP